SASFPLETARAPVRDSPAIVGGGIERRESLEPLSCRDAVAGSIAVPHEAPERFEPRARARALRLERPRVLEARFEVAALEREPDERPRRGPADPRRALRPGQRGRAAEDRVEGRLRRPAGPARRAQARQRQLDREETRLERRGAAVVRNPLRGG